MAFDTREFIRTKFEPRTAAVRVPSLAPWFGENDEPLWTVRGQTASEIARVQDETSRQKNLDAIVQALSSNQDKIAELREAIGVDTVDVPVEIARRLTQLVTCSVEPVIDRPLAVKLAETFPIEFYQITNKIVELTGLGMDVKKPLPSGERA